MVEIRKPISISEAVAAVLESVKQNQKEYIDITDADGRILADPLTADHDVPPFDRSPYDGFAIRAEDSAAARQDSPVRLAVIETIGAGAVAGRQLQKGEAIRIMTGAAIPAGADAVVPFEAVDEKDATIILSKALAPGTNISRQGEDINEGVELLPAGTAITPGVVAALATFGYGKVPVTRQPVVGVIATGTELLDLTEKLVPGKIRNSNAYMIMAQIRKAGGKPVYFGQMKDDFELSFTAVEEALSGVDVLITTGGVSVGDFDFLPQIYKRLGAEVLFNKVAMRPGSVTTVAKLGRQFLFGLSGNPSACFVGFELFAGPYLREMLGAREPHLLKTSALLASDFPKANPFTRMVRARAFIKDGRWYAESVRLDKSNVVTSLAEANALMRLPGGTKGYQTGDPVDVMLLGEYSSSDPWQ